MPEDLIAVDERRGAEISATAQPEEIPLAAPPKVQPLETHSPRSTHDRIRFRLPEDELGGPAAQEAA